MRSPQKNAITINPNRNPPVGPNRTAKPPFIPANTGIPTAPISTYTAVDTVPVRAPPTAAHNATPKVCSVMGTLVGSGTVTCAETAIIAAKSAHMTIG